MIFQADKPSIAWRYYRESPGRWVIVDFPNRFAEDPAWYDIVHDFLRTLEDLRLARIDPMGRVDAEIFYDLYVKWASSNDREVLDKKAFTIRLQHHGITKHKIGRNWVYKGIIRSRSLT